MTVNALLVFYLPACGSTVHVATSTAALNAFSWAGSGARAFVKKENDEAFGLAGAKIAMLKDRAQAPGVILACSDEARFVANRPDHSDAIVVVFSQKCSHRVLCTVRRSKRSALPLRSPAFSVCWRNRSSIYADGSSPFSTTISFTRQRENA